MSEKSERRGRRSKKKEGRAERKEESGVDERTRKSGSRNDRNGVRVLFTNAQSVVKKMDELKVKVECVKPDLIIGSHIKENFTLVY